MLTKVTDTGIGDVGLRPGHAVDRRTDDVAAVELISVDDVNEAWERVMNADVRYRFVIDTKTFD